MDEVIDVRLVSLSAVDNDPAFPLEAGALSPVDVATFITPLSRPSFSALVGDAFQPLSDLHGAIDTGHATIADASDPAAFDGAASAALDEASGAHSESAAAFDAANPSEVIGATNNHSGAIDGTRSGYDETPPATQDPPDPGQPPLGGGGRGPRDPDAQEN